MPQERGHRRRHSRSVSPSTVPNKHKRSWQNSDSDRFGGGTERQRHYNRLVSPGKGGQSDFKSPAKVSDRRNYSESSGAPHKSHPSHGQKTSHSEGRGISSSSYPRPSPPGPASRGRDKFASRSPRDNGWSGSRSKQRSSSVRSQHVQENRRETKTKRLSSSPQPGPSIKKKKRPSPASMSPPLKHSRSRSRGRSPVSSSQTRIDSSAAANSGSLIPQRKVTSSSSKRKSPRLTLHKRFTHDDQETFEIEENVTIAILRKPDAQPSEDVTVKKVFDAAQFKMIHKKTEGRKPIFDREEIKVWRHDENLTDDPDYEYRLVRVKSVSGTSKSARGSLSRMSPDVIRKAIGQQTSGKSNTSSASSSHVEPQIRLDPRPDARYESRFRQQVEKEEDVRTAKRRDGDRKRGSSDTRGITDTRGGKVHLKERKWEDEKRDERGKEETYDLRQALERRRSDKEDSRGGLRVEIRHENVSETDLYYADSRQTSRFSSTDHRRLPPDQVPGRNVIVDEDRARKQFGGQVGRDRGPFWNGRRFGDSQGFDTRNRGRRREWSTVRGEMDGGMREEGLTHFRDGDRSFDMRQQYNNTSPPATRGWRGGYRGRGRGQARDFIPYEPHFTLPPVINDSFKYSQHDDRDASPKPFRSRGGRGRFGPRNFGGKNFRAVTRGSRGGFRGFRGGPRGRGFGSPGERRSIDRERADSVDREWKHDMYDSLQTNEEQPHSTTVGI